jgi:hypothetical protein
VARAKRAAPAPTTSRSADRANLRLYVVFTDLNATRLALDAANSLAHGLNCQIVLVVAQVVPYVLPLERPPVPPGFLERTLSELACENEVVACVYLCRERDETIRQSLSPNSLVLIGVEGNRSWWWGRDRRLIRQLRRDGHEVIAVHAGSHRPAAVELRKVESGL